MGNQVNCCNTEREGAERYSVSMMDSDRGRRSLWDEEDEASFEEHTDMNVLEFEQRVKMHATAENMGFVSVEQLLHGFRGTAVFAHMRNPNSVKTKFILSPFVADFPLGSHLQGVEPTPR